MNWFMQMEKKIALNIGWSLSWLGIILFIVHTIQNMQFKL